MSICCPACSTLTVDKSLQRSITSRGVKYPFTWWHTVCPNCSLDVIPSDLSQINRNAYDQVCLTIPDFINPSLILTIREIYDFTQSEAGEYFGVSLVVWQAFELGNLEPEPTLVATMKAALASCDAMIDIILASRPISA
jgi:DNA-binding transcriptional regulator YiaG